MEIELDLRKGVAENASTYFEKSKKAKKKLEGLVKSIEDTRSRLEKLKEKQFLLEEEEKAVPLKKREKKWFEKFHWFYSSNGFLVIAGRDSRTNEEIIKKYMEKDDLYFHAEIQGSPHCIIKTNKSEVPSSIMNEAAQFVASFSKGWREKLSSLDVYSVLPEQVSKKAPSGESMKSGSFMIYGKRNYFKKIPLELAIGVKKEGEEFIVISGPLTAIKKNSIAFVKVIQGEEKKGIAAKKLKELLEKKLGLNEKLDLDEIIAMLPAGGTNIGEGVGNAG
ncbi:MAG: NFACT RNA binding domain-containing protein [archaeon]|nr:DUF814 domain-containing protein [Candidatus Micrarchaeota archaeon]